MIKKALFIHNDVLQRMTTVPRNRTQMMESQPMTRTLQQRRSNLVIVVSYLHIVDEQIEEGGENAEMDV